MRNKNLLAMLACAVCLTVAAPVVMAEEETEAVMEQTVRPDYTASDYVVLGEYKGLVVEPESSEVTDEEIDAEVEQAIRFAGALDVLTEGTVQDGDIANIDYEGKLNGVAFDGGTAKGYDLTIGSHSFINGFEDGLIGVAVGETVDLNLTFPENYSSEDLAGQDTVFTVTVNEIQRIPELTDDLVKTITENAYADVASYRDSIRVELEGEKEEMVINYAKADLLSMVADNSEITDYPADLVEYTANNMRSYYREYAASYSMEFEEFLTAFFGMTEEEFESEVMISVKENLAQEMYLKAIMEAEGMELTDAEYAAGAQELADMNTAGSVETLEEQYGKDMITLSILEEKVLDLLYDNAVIFVEEETEVETEA